MQVTIDGVRMHPPAPISSRIGIAITTHQRAEVLKRALEQHMKHLPAGALVVVIDDGSKPAAVVPDGVQLLRNETSLGIVASKNASLSALMDAGVRASFFGMTMHPLPIICACHSDLQSRTGLSVFSIWRSAKD